MNTQHSNMKWIYVALAFSLVAFTACTEMELCAVEDHPHRVPVTIKLDWGDVPEEERLDSLFVFVGNQLYAGNYVYAYYVKEDCFETYEPGRVHPAVPEEPTTSESDKPGTGEGGNTEPTEGGGTTGQLATTKSEDGTGGGGQGDEGTGSEGGKTDEGSSTGDGSSSTGEPEEAKPETPQTNPLEHALAGGGDYLMLACNMNLEKVTVNWQGFRNNSRMSVANMTIADKRLSAPDFVGYNAKTWVKYNSSYPYLSNMGPVFASDVAMHVPHKSANTTITFAPRKITQHIRVRVHLKQDVALPIDSVIGELSGVVPSVTMSNGLLNTNLNTTGKVCFKMTAPDGTAVAEEVDYEGGFDAFGLIPGEASSGYGASILHLMIFVKDKTYNMYANLTKQVVEANLLVYDDALGGYRKNREEATLDMPVLLEVTKLMTGETDGSMTPGTDGWFYVEDHDIKDET